MAYLQQTKDDINQAYQDIFGRDASFGTLGGADYWADQVENQGLSDSELRRILTESSEGQSVTTDPTTGAKSSWIGGVNPNLSIAQNIANDANATNPWDKSWASHFTTGGVFAPDANLDGTIWEGMAGAGTTANPNTTQNVAQLLNQTYNANNPNATLQSPYYNNAPIVSTTNDDGTSSTNIPVVDTGTGTGTGTDTGTDTGTGNWWESFADIDAFKDALGLGNNNQSSSMSDFMQFMMFMNMMRPQGGGYGGSQYGYGGLNPGGVMSAYNPMDNFQGYMDAFNTLRGGTTTNTGTTT